MVTKWDKMERRQRLYELVLKGNTTIQGLARELGVSRKTVWRDMCEIRELNERWFEKNKEFEERAKNYLKEIVDQIDLVIRRAFRDYERLPDYEKDEEGVNISGIAHAKKAFLDLIRRAIVDKASILGIHGISLKDMEISQMMKEIRELEKKYHEIKLKQELR